MACTLVQPIAAAAACAHVRSHNRKQRAVANVRMLCDRISAPSLSIGFHSISTTAAPRTRGFARFVFERIWADELDDYTEEGFQVIKLAHKEATRMGHNYVGTEQILLGLIAQGGTGIAATVLKSAGICLEDARVQVEKMIGKGNAPIFLDELDEMPILLPVLEHTPHVMKHALAVSRKTRPEHYLLGLLSDDECLAVRVLKNLGADPNNIRTQVIQMIAETTQH